MAKKKEPELGANLLTTPALTPAQYWEWRNACTQVWLANYKVKVSETEAKVMQRETEILNMRVQLHVATQLKAAKEDALNSRQEYQKIKEALEDILGTSLNNKVIDDVTFQVKDAPEDPAKSN